MMEKLSVLDATALKAATLEAAKNEKTATLILLECLSEIDRRRLYAEWAYGSLFEYVHKGLGYSEAQSSERVSAVRLLREVPEVKVALEKGALTLTSTAKLASHVRRENPSPERTLELLSQCEGKPTRAVERILLSNASLHASAPERVRAVSPTETKLSVTVDEEFMALVTRMRELGGNPGEPLAALFSRAMTEYVKRREVKRDASPSRAASRAPEVKTRSRYIPVSVRNQIRLRSGDQCEYREERTGRRCEHTHGLEFDHVHAFARGGLNSVENIRHTCRVHNLLFAVKTYGTEKMGKYLSWG